MILDKAPSPSKSFYYKLRLKERDEGRGGKGKEKGKKGNYNDYKRGKKRNPISLAVLDRSFPPHGRKEGANPVFLFVT